MSQEWNKIASSNVSAISNVTMFCVPKPKHQKVYKNHVKKRLEMILKLAVIQLMIGWSGNLIVKGKKNYLFFVT